MSETTDQPVEYTDDVLKRLINEGSAMFDAAMQERHNAGAAEYGHFAFLGNDTIRMAMEEIVDLANYARYTFIKMWILVCQLEDFHNKQEGQVGPGAFISSSGRED